MHKASEGSFARSEVLCINEGALMADGRNWECLFIYEAPTRHLGLVTVLKDRGGNDNLYIWGNRHRGLT